MAANRSALTAALAGDAPADDGAAAAPFRLDASSFPCLAARDGAAPADAGGDAVADLAGFERLTLRGVALAGSAPTAALLADGSAAVSVCLWGGGRLGHGTWAP